MNVFVTSVAICTLLGAKASAGYSGYKLEGVPDEQHFSKIHYPEYNILPLGEYRKGFLPADEIKIYKHEKLEVPQPYPVKVPVPQPYPVHVPKPYPVEHTKYVKVPFPVTQVVEKKVPYPVEVPKPYPVHIPAHQGHHGIEQHHEDLGGYESAPQITSNLGGELQHADESSGQEGYQEAQYGGQDVSSYDAKGLQTDYDENGGNQGWQPLNGGDGHY